MPFELDHQAATLKSVTPRKETHGDSKVTAVSFGLKFTAPNTLLDHLSPTLRTTLYMPVTRDAEQEPLPDIDPPTPLLRTKGITEIDLGGTLEGWTISVEHGIGEAMTFGGCKLDAFKVTPMEGGTVELHLRVGTNDIDAGEIGLLCDKLQEEVVVSITAPIPMEQPIDGSRDGGGPGFADDGAQSSLLDHDAERSADDATAAFLSIHGGDGGSDDGGPPDSDTDSGASDGDGSDTDVRTEPRTELPRTVKYRSPQTGETWSGRGLQPRWLKAALAAGQRLEDFEVATA